MLQHLRDGSTVTIWGDGSVVRDFTYIDDMVSAVQCVLADPNATGTFNVGSGVGYSLNNLVSAIETTCGSRLQVEYDSSRSMDVQRVVLDISAIESKDNWAAAVSLSERVARTWEWLCIK